MSRDKLMFFIFTGISALLPIEALAASAVGGYRTCELWLWVFAFPVMLVYQEWGERFVFPILLLNPFIYGSIWWVGWRALRPLWRKRKKDKSPRCTKTKPPAQQLP